MRWIGAILIVLAILVSVACQVEIDGSPIDGVPIVWVRTVDGWEKPGDWLPRAPVYDPPLHPVILALGQMLISLLALLGLGNERRA